MPKRRRVLHWRPEGYGPVVRFNADDVEPVVVVYVTDIAETDRAHLLVLSSDAAVVLARKLSTAAGQARQRNEQRRYLSRRATEDS